MKKINPLIIIGLAVLAVSSVSALTYWIYSDVITVTVAEYKLTLSSDAPAQPIPLYTLINFSATLLFNGSPVKDAVVEFTMNGTMFASSSTDASGITTSQYNVTIPGIYDFRAQYQATS